MVNLLKIKPNTDYPHDVFTILLVFLILKSWLLVPNFNFLPLAGRLEITVDEL